jgi:hypothetical protein
VVQGSTPHDFPLCGVVSALPVIPVLVCATGGGLVPGGSGIGFGFTGGTLVFDGFDGGGLGASAVCSPVPGA